MTFVLNLSSAIKWKMVLDTSGLKVSLWRNYAYYNIGKFFNLVLPTSMGGDVVRVLLMGNFTGKKHTAAASVIVERFTGLMALLFFATVAVILNIRSYNHTWLSLSLMTGILALVSVAWLVLSDKAYFFITSYLQNKNRFISLFISKVEKIRKPVLDYSNNWNTIAWALFNSVIFQLLAIFNVWFSSLAFGSEISLATCFVAVPVIMFIMNIPFSIGGLGLMEFGYVFTFSLFSVPTSLALSTALLIRSKGIVDCIIGGVLNLFMNNSKTNHTDN